MTEDTADDNNVDRAADTEIAACVNLAAPKSFFLFAGAGSGKTRSLVECLDEIRREHTGRLRLRGQRVGVITYTNAACDEIKERLNHDPFIEVSTIHSFVWSIIKGLNADIREWVRANLLVEIAELEEKQAKGRASKASQERAASIDSKNRRLAYLNDIKSFIYNPNGDNRGKDSLNHAEVLKIGSEFLLNKPTMQRILIGRHPILLIDESQDTNRLLMDALFYVQAAWRDAFCLGLFGDMMQRIYADGKPDLGRVLPADWAKPIKKMNHRCPKRIVRLINKIRESSDGQQQQARSDAAEGFVRLYALPAGTGDKRAAEQRIAADMAKIAGDAEWDSGNRKMLILEHHMAARRLDFFPMFEPLYRNGLLKTGLLDGSLGGLRLFSDLVLPLVTAKLAGDEFKVAAIVRENSPLLSKVALAAAGEAKAQQIVKARDAVLALVSLWEDGAQPKFIDVLKSVAASGLFEIPDSLVPMATRSDAEQALIDEIDQIDLGVDEDQTSQLATWDSVLATPFGQIEKYKRYVSGEAEFDTHQGVKGLEFPRVGVVIDDSEAGGFLFSYDKLFGVKERSKTDLQHEQAGEETGIDRTRRLFYVTCSRAEQSLAIICYSEDPKRVRDFVIKQGWFDENEVVLLN
jgi:DNA helicase-2/ATP-dependent DNA helicase PcrA